MDAAEFDYDLPDAAIAQTPVEPRDSARLLVDRGPGQDPDDRHVRDLPALLGPGDLVVLNDTRVFNARLRLTKPTGGLVEVLLLESRGPGSGSGPIWEALVRPSRKVPAGTVLRGTAMDVSVGEDLGEGRRLVELIPHPTIDVAEAIAVDGELALPPYIHEALADPERYQTMFHGLEPGNRPGHDALESVAAPTAGLHLTPDVLRRIVGAGAEVAMVRLAVGLGTFRPITAERVEDHVMHEERFGVPLEVQAACERADRVVAVGTTVVRALESAARTVGAHGRTDLFIHGDYDFRVVDAMVTNFHVPRSSLLVMLDAFIGPPWKDLYATALARNYRFLSFGDAMFLSRRAR